MTTNGEAASTAVQKAEPYAVQGFQDTGSGSIAAFSGLGAFEAAQRMAKALASSSLVPKEYRGNVANCLVAMELASRTRASVFMVMQNLDIIHGRPSWRAKFAIGTVNSSGRFRPLRFQWEGTKGQDDWGCKAVSYDLETETECVGPLITIALAKAEGWFAKDGSKWKTLPEKMLMYRAGAWWADIFCPELMLGMMTDDEAREIGPEETSVPAVGTAEATRHRLEELRARVGGGEQVDTATGEIVQDADFTVEGGEQEAQPTEAAAEPEATEKPAEEPQAKASSKKKAEPAETAAEQGGELPL